MVSLARIAEDHLDALLGSGYHRFFGIATVLTARPCNMTEIEIQRHKRHRKKLAQVHFDLRHRVIKLTIVIHGFVNSSFRPKSLNVAPPEGLLPLCGRAIHIVRIKDAVYSNELTKSTSKLLLKKPRAANLRSASTSAPST
jgi:hypothetical protein